jgi:ribonuclease HI
MSVPAPHFLLYAEAALAADGDDSIAERWRFVLRTAEGETAAEAADDEPAASRERLELLAVIRGLESLDQPSRVTLMSGSRSLQCGLESGLSQWRENNWHWERYGRLTPIKNADLWRRLDRLSSIHTIHCPQSRTRSSDDLAPPATRTTKSGRKLRIDPPFARQSKSEITSTKSQTSSKFQFPKVRQERRFRHWILSPLNLIDAWRLVLGALGRLRPTNTSRSKRTNDTKRGVSRAHHRLARRHERSARRPVGPPA